jgi:hypothetical protein
LKSTDRSWGFSSGHKDVFHQETQIIDETEDADDVRFLLSDDESTSRAVQPKEKGNWGWKGKGKGKRVDDIVIQ